MKGRRRRKRIRGRRKGRGRGGREREREEEGDEDSRIVYQSQLAQLVVTCNNWLLTFMFCYDLLCLAMTF